MPQTILKCSSAIIIAVSSANRVIAEPIPEFKTPNSIDVTREVITSGADEQICVVNKMNMVSKIYELSEYFKKAAKVFDLAIYVNFN